MFDNRFYRSRWVKSWEVLIKLSDRNESRSDSYREYIPRIGWKILVKRYIPFSHHCFANDSFKKKKKKRPRLTRSWYFDVKRKDIISKVKKEKEIKRKRIVNTELGKHRCIPNVSILFLPPFLDEPSVLTSHFRAEYERNARRGRTRSKVVGHLAC